MRGIQIFADELADAIAQKLRDRQPEKRLFTVQESAQYLGCSPDQIEEWTKTGRLRAVKLDRRARYDRNDLDRLVDMSKVS